MIKMKKCKCGCGELITKKNNKYIQGHNHRGKTYEEIYGEKAEEHRNKRRDASLGQYRPDMIGDKNFAKRPEIRAKIKKGVTESWKSKKGKIRKKQMKEYQAAYMNFFIKNPSKPQIELYNMVLEICPYAILNYPSLSYSIDIAIPFLNIAIEYDEPYWHQDENKDKERQEKLEKEGWIFFRFKSVPSKEELKFIKEVC